MKISSITLNDKDSVLIDNGKKSLAYFAKKRPVKVDAELIKKLKETISKLDKNVRLCLHESPDSLFHDMIILERKGKYYRPHKHKKKEESFHIIEGEMAVFIFDEKGGIIDACKLDPHKNFIYRIGLDMYHAVMPLSDLVIYHESKPGPFTGEGDSIYPSWAPDESNENKVVKLQKKMMQEIEK